MRSAMVAAVVLLGACGPGVEDAAPGQGVPRDVAAEQARGRALAEHPLAQPAGPSVRQELQAEVAARVTERSCFGYCHIGKTGHSPFLEIDPGLSKAVPRFKLVEPGKPEESWMWLKITGAYRLVPECVADPKRCGEPMPRYLATLTDEEKSAIRQWIESGATPRWTRYGEW